MPKFQRPTGTASTGSVILDRAASNSAFSGATALLLCLGFFHPAEGQTVSGLVAEQGTLAPVPGAAVMVFRVGNVTEADDPVEVAREHTDDEGAFTVRLPGPGTYRLQAEAAGLMSPMSERFTVEPGGDGPDDVALLLPARALMLAGSCDVEAESGAVVVGTAWDEDGGFPLPFGTVVARWQDGEERRAEVSHTGHYLFCGVAVGELVAFRLETLGALGEWVEVDIPRPALVLHDVYLDLATAETPAAAPPEVQIRVAEVSADRERVTGVLSDATTAAPIADAVVELRPTERRRLTDSSGRFNFPNVEPGDYALVFRHLAYGDTDYPIRVDPGADLSVSVALTHVVLGLDGVEVTARSRVEEAIRRSPSAAPVLAGARLAEAETRGATPVEVLRTLPGVTVRPVDGPGNRFRVMGRDGFVRVIVDGVRMDDALDYLSLHEIESMQLLGPVEATTRYGLARQGEGSSVLLIYTRGKGPFRGDPARDCVGC